MGHQHNHSHSEHHADKWTNIAAAGELAASFISDAYWLATLFDVASGLPDSYIGLSVYGIGFGIVSACLSAGGAAYSHRVLNTIHQPDNLSTENVENGKNIQAITEETPLVTNHVKLTTTQKLALIGDYISHVGDIAGPMTFVTNLATVHYKTPKWGRLVVQCGATLFGGIASVANVRSCKDAMLEKNQSLQRTLGV